MIVNGAALRSIYQGFKTIFNGALQNAKAQYLKVATEVPSSAKSEEYKWLGSMPRLRKWIGERVIQNLSAYSWTIKNEPYEATVGVDREDVEDDSIGVYRPVIEELGQAAAMHPDELVWGLLKNGFTQPCYDGQYFFDADHRDGDGPIQSNRGNRKLTPAAYAEARAQQMSLLDDKGKPLGVIGTLLVVAPKNEQAGLEILQAERLATGATNVYRNTAELLVVPELADMPDAWFLIDGSKPVKPLIFQRRKKPEFVSLDQADNENVFMNKKFLYGVDCRDNAGYGLWHLAYGSTGDVA